MERKRSSASNIRVKLRDNEIKEVKEFKYLGSMITDTAQVDRDVNMRVQKAEGFFQSVRKLLWDEDFPQQCKVLLYKMYFLPILTYGAVTWAIGEKEKSHLQAAQMKFLRSVKGVTRMDRIRSRKIRSELNVERLDFKMGRERLRWFGHMKRMDRNRIPRREFETTLLGKRRVGRPREKWSGLIKEDVAAREEIWDAVEEAKLWEDRIKWRELVRRKEEVEEDEEDETCLASRLLGDPRP
jgi:hypothetical protein